MATTIMENLKWKRKGDWNGSWDCIVVHYREEQPKMLLVAGSGTITGEGVEMSEVEKQKDRASRVQFPWAFYP